MTQMYNIRPIPVNYDIIHIEFSRCVLCYFMSLLFDCGNYRCVVHICSCTVKITLIQGGKIHCTINILIDNLTIYVYYVLL